MTHNYTEAQDIFIRKNSKGKKVNEITEMFNNYFGLNLKNSQIRAYKKNHKIKSGVDCKFQPGVAPPNKGTHIGGWKPTQFKKGHKPHNYLPIGSERVNGDGYIDIKIAEPNKWKGKHILVWEEVNGPITKGYAVIFGDRNRRNFEPSNLILVSRQQLGTLNNKKLIQHDADLTRTGVIIADIYQKMSKRKSE